jgi:flagellar basal-body rod protein FlgC
MSRLFISATGILAAQRRLEIGAHNVANIDTPGFQARRAQSVELPGGGTAARSLARETPDRLELPAAPAFPGRLPRSNVNLATEQVNSILNREAFRANVNALRAQDEIIGELLDLSD